MPSVTEDKKLLQDTENNDNYWAIHQIILYMYCESIMDDITTQEQIEIVHIPAESKLLNVYKKWIEFYENSTLHKTFYPEVN
jgi:hypothetical protein